MKKIVIVSMLALGISTTVPASSLQAHVGDRFLEFCKDVSDDCRNLAIDFVKNLVAFIRKNKVKTIAAVLLIYMYLMAQGNMGDIEKALEVFGLPASTTDFKVVRRVYRQLAKTYHPDKCFGSECAKKMVQINIAYKSLSKRLG